MKRIDYFDNAKEILIIILAHVLSLYSNYYNYNDEFFSLLPCLCYNAFSLFQYILQQKVRP